MDIKKVGKKFYQTYQKEDGSLFKGLIGKIPMTGRYINYVVGGMILFVSPACKLECGDIFTSQTGRVMMVMDNGDEESIGATQKSFVIRILTRKVSWKRQADVVDSITKMRKTTEIKNMGSFWCSFESVGNVADNTHITVGKYVFICNKPLKEGDIIDDTYRITKSENLLGVTIANASKC